MRGQVEYLFARRERLESRFGGGGADQDLAAAAAGAMAIVQPLSLVYVHGRELRAGLREIKGLAGGRPFGFNAIIEKSVKAYEDRMRGWIDVALEEGVRFFVTALGNPSWVCKAVHQVGGVVYHDVTERKWALKAKDAGVATDWPSPAPK